MAGKWCRVGGTFGIGLEVDLSLSKAEELYIEVV